MSRNGHILTMEAEALQDNVRDANRTRRIHVVNVVRIPSECQGTAYCSESPSHMVGNITLCETHMLELVRNATMLKTSLY